MIGHLFVFATITPKPEFFEDAQAAIAGIVPDTRKEVGCFQFVLHANTEEGCLYLYEEWQDQAALDRHYTMPYVGAVFLKYQEWLAVPVDIKKFSKLL